MLFIPTAIKVCQFTSMPWYGMLCYGYLNFKQRRTDGRMQLTNRVRRGTVRVNTVVLQGVSVVFKLFSCCGRSGMCRVKADYSVKYLDFTVREGLVIIAHMTISRPFPLYYWLKISWHKNRVSYYYITVFLCMDVYINFISWFSFTYLNSMYYTSYNH
jgi:hypothetical protein